MEIKNKLAILGGSKAIKEAMPKRRAFGKTEEEAVYDVIQYYKSIDQDPGYQGKFEKQFCDTFSKYMGGGYTTAVATGTGSVYVALAALELPKGSDIILSPITDPGSFNAIVLQGFTVSLADSNFRQLNTSWSEIEKVITAKTSAIMIVHCAGISTDIDKIVKNAKKLNIKVIEDCSQAPGAIYKGQQVGSFGDVAAISTMGRKSIASGGSGGLVYTTNKETHKKIISYADRGKKSWSDDFEERNANKYLFPALNWNTDELSCAIGLASLSRLKETIQNRLLFANYFNDLVSKHLTSCYINISLKESSPFFITINLNTSSLTCTKEIFCDALIAEGVELNPNYQFVIAEWQWASLYLTQHCKTPNAIAARDASLNLYLNENYTAKTAEEIITAFIKVERYYKIIDKDNN